VGFLWQKVYIHNTVVCVVSGAIYPYPAMGSPYQTADHFWPFQNISGGLVDDVQGAAHTIVYNGGRIKKILQLGTSLYLDGKDDWVDTGMLLIWVL